MGGRGSPMPPVDVQSGPSRTNTSTQEGRRTGSGSSNASSKQSPAKTVAGALKKLFRLSSDKGADSPTHNHSPSTHAHGGPGVYASKQQQQQAVTSPVAVRAGVDNVKTSSFKHSSSMEPNSILDYDERFSALTDRPSAQSAITDRTSILTSERASSLRDSKGTALSRTSSRASSSSRLGTYIRSIIKSGTSTTPTSQTQQTAGSPPTSPSANAAGSHHHQQPHDVPAKMHSGGSPFQTSMQSAQHGASIILGSSTTAAVPVPHTTQASAPARGLFTNMPAHSNPPQPQVHPSSSPRGLYDNTLVLPPPCATALQRMQRDPNLLTVCNDLPASMDRPSWRVEDYTLIQKIHAGYASAVYKAYCKHSGQTVALKVYQPAKLHEISQYQLYREARLHTQMNHPNIIKLYAAFRHGDNVVLVQEYADGGDLLQLLMQHGTRLSERRATQLVLQPLLRALYYLHSRFIVHRDVKLENILFTGREMTLKVADFGLCLNLREERSVTRAGTLDYMAPEVLRCPQKHRPQDNKERLDLAYDMTVDVWALGVVAYELLNGCPPFTCHDKKETEKRITSGLMPEFVVDVSEAARDFVYSCLSRYSEQRPTAWQLLRNPWLKSGTRSSQPTLMESLHAHRMARAAAAAGAGAAQQLDTTAELQRLQQQHEEAVAAERAAAVAAAKAAAVPSSSSLPSAARTHAAHEAAAAAAALQAAAEQKQHELLSTHASAPAPASAEHAHSGTAAAAAVRPGTANSAAAAVTGSNAQITAANYTPGRVAAMYSKLQAVTDDDSAHDGVHVTTPTSARPAGSPTGRNSLSAKNSQPLVPTSQLVQQQQPAQPASRFPAPYAGKIHVRTSAPAASALKALQAAAGGGAPASPSTAETATSGGAGFGPPAGLSHIQTSPPNKRLSSPNTPRTPLSAAAIAAQTHGPFSIPIPLEEEAGQPVYEGVMNSQFPHWLVGMAASLPRAPYGVPLLPTNAAAAGALPAATGYGGLPQYPAMASIASMPLPSRTLEAQLRMAGANTASSTMVPAGASYALRVVRDALMSNTSNSKLLPRQWTNQSSTNLGPLIAAVHPTAGLHLSLDKSVADGSDAPY